jgi:glycosyltransferase involved in cell wall biosynthesis
MPPVSGLRFRLERPLPAVLAVGGGNHLTLDGWCYHPAGPVVELRITQNGRPVDQPVFRRVRPDIHLIEHPAHDPAGHSMDGGFAATIDVPTVCRETPTTFGLEARLADRSIHRAELGRVLLRTTVDSGARPPAIAARADGSPLVAVCMATYDPPPVLFGRQIASIVAQTHTNWICIITDDGSPPESFARIAALSQRDSRFHVYRNQNRLGFYHNFERCLSLVPAAARFVALSDHDDDWRPDKLATLLSRFNDRTQLVYSDMRIVTAGGECLSDTYWTTRRNNYTDLVSLLVANTITGAASVFRRELLVDVLPFPDRHGHVFHDHWIAAVALARGKIRYVRRPLYDYVQHDGNVIGHRPLPPAPWLDSLRQLWESLRPFDRRVWFERLMTYGKSHDVRYDPARQFARLLLRRCGSTLSPANRRALQRFGGADRSATAWLWLALRGLLHNPVTRGGEFEMLASLLWRAGSAALVRRRLARQAPNRTSPPIRRIAA